jgi:tryptophan synthase alpha chain
MTDLPIAVGFGISTPAQAAAITPLADGIVIGSALVRLIGENGKSAGLIDQASSFAKEIRRAIDTAGCGR